MERKTPLYDVHVEEGGKIVPSLATCCRCSTAPASSRSTWRCASRRASLMSPTWERSSSPAPRPWTPSTTCSPTTTTAWR